MRGGGSKRGRKEIPREKERKEGWLEAGPSEGLGRGRADADQCRSRRKEKKEMAGGKAERRLGA